VTKKERVEASVSGREFDYPPMSFWYHFGTQHEGGEKAAEIHLAYARYYDLDFLKVMNDYYYPMPEGKLELKSAEDLKAIQRFDIHKTPWAEQLKAADILARELDGEMYFIDTVFEPWQCMLRNMAGEHLMDLVEREPIAFLEAMDVVTENVIDYCLEVLKRGAAGIFLSTFASKKQLPKDVYMKFSYPFVERVMKAVEGKGILNTLHLHDLGIYTEEAVKLPCDAISYEDVDDSNPSIEEMRKHYSGSLMCGMHKRVFTRVTPQKVIDNAVDGVTAGGKTKFFLAPGCSIENWLYPPSAKMAIERAREAYRSST
jgi:uroporphyrinogen decarboxylase